MFLRRRPHSGHEFTRNRICVGEAEVAKECQELPHDQVHHGERNAGRNGSYDGNTFEDVELGIAEGEDSLCKTVPARQPLLGQMKDTATKSLATLTIKPLLALFFSFEDSPFSSSNLIGI